MKDILVNFQWKMSECDSEPLLFFKPIFIGIQFQFIFCGQYCDIESDTFIGWSWLSDHKFWCFETEFNLLLIF